MSNTRPGIFRRILGAIGSGISWLRIIVLNGLFLLLVLFMFASLFGSNGGPLPDRAPLRIQLAGNLVDQRNYIDPIASIVSQSQGVQSETVVRDLVRAIDSASTDERISKMILDLHAFTGGGISKLEEIGQALLRFKNVGKEIIAVSDFYTQNQYYLASYADQIYLHPMGSVLLTGYSSYRNYYHDALDKLSVNMHIFRVGEYKDAVEPFVRSDMSEESREHNSLWLNQLWSVYTSRVETQRQLPKDAINDYINNYDKHLDAVSGDAAQLAINSRMVDELATRDEVRRKFTQEFGANNAGDSYLSIDYLRYLKEVNKKQTVASDKIALLVASGTIYDGVQPPGNIGGDSLAKQIRQLREDDNIRALVLRIDSGGGSAFASEIIRNELVATRASGIPVIVSMGSVAASGGYWIAANADQIWATPTTLTGSIGVFAVFPTLENTLTKLGVNTDGVGTTDLADAMRLDMPVSPLAANVLQHQVDNIYRKFIGLVAEGRDSVPDLIHPIAQGRVWSGSSAQTFGLVDELGYLDEAIASAARIAGISQYEVKLIEPVLTPFEQFVQSVSAQGINIGKTTGLLSSLSGTDQMGYLLAQGYWKNLTDLLHMFNANQQPLTIYAHCMQCVIPE